VEGLEDSGTDWTANQKIEQRLKMLIDDLVKEIKEQGKHVDVLLVKHHYPVLAAVFTMLGRKLDPHLQPFILYHSTLINFSYHTQLLEKARRTECRLAGIDESPLLERNVSISSFHPPNVALIMKPVGPGKP
jgi:hypothetical protein